MKIDPLLLSCVILVLYIVYKILVKKKVDKKKILYYSIGIIIVLVVVTWMSYNKTQDSIMNPIVRPKQLFSLSPTSIKLPTKFD